MACGVPCVATDVGDSAYIVGETGRIVSPGDPAALAEAMGEIAAMGEEGRRGLGKAARRRIRDLFNLPAVVAEYERIYAEG
jgi:glycosyltransferase involved in cell wall biosynthesis